MEIEKVNIKQEHKRKHYRFGNSSFDAALFKIHKRNRGWIQRGGGRAVVPYWLSFF